MHRVGSENAEKGRQTRITKFVHTLAECMRAVIDLKYSD